MDSGRRSLYSARPDAGMTELVDVPDLKSGASNGVPVQLRLPAPGFAITYGTRLHQ